VAGRRQTPPTRLSHSSSDGREGGQGNAADISNVSTEHAGRLYPSLRSSVDADHRPGLGASGDNSRGTGPRATSCDIAKDRGDDAPRAARAILTASSRQVRSTAGILLLATAADRSRLPAGCRGRHPRQRTARAGRLAVFASSRDGRRTLDTALCCVIARARTYEVSVNWYTGSVAVSQPKQRNARSGFTWIEAFVWRLALLPLAFARSSVRLLSGAAQSRQFLRLRHAQQVLLRARSRSPDRTRMLTFRDGGRRPARGASKRGRPISAQ